MSVVVFAILLWTESYYRDYLFDKSLTVIPQIQNGASEIAKKGWG
jgi:hypothetical protein